MRRDIQKVVFERAKANRTWASRTPRVKQVVLDNEGEELNEPANGGRRRRQKWRNSHFNVIKRFLVRNAGRPWSKVWAELCESADARSLLGSEIRDFAEDCVAIRAWSEDGKVMTYDCKGGREEVRGLYVHPKTGVLLRAGR